MGSNCGQKFNYETKNNKTMSQKKYAVAYCLANAREKKRILMCSLN